MNQAVKIGLITGAVAAVSIIVKIKVEMPVLPLTIVHFTGMIAFVGGIYVAVKRTRDREMGGFIGFRQALRSGTITALISSIFQAVAMYYCMTTVDYLHVNNPLTNKPFSETPSLLLQISEQNMFNGTIYWTIPNILLGFMVSVAAGLLLRKNQEVAQH